MIRKAIAITMVLMMLIMVPFPNGNAETRAGNIVKLMVLYVHNATEAQYIFDYSTTHIANTTLGNRLQGVGDIQRVRMDWYVAPVLAGNLTVNGNITFTVFANTTGVSANANLNLEVYEVTYKSGARTDETLVATGGPESYTLTSSIDSYSVSASVHHTFKKGSSIRIHLEVQGGASSYFKIWYGDKTYDSRVTFDSLDYLRVAEVYTMNYRDEKVNAFDPNDMHKTIKIMANLTDPFGGYDIRWAKVTVIGPDGNRILNNASMTKVEGTPISYSSLFEKDINYGGLSVGTYRIIVYAMDNNGYYYYTHMQKYNYGVYGDTGYGEFSIGFPNTVHFTVLDALGAPLPDAEVDMLYHENVMASGTTDSDGNLSMGVYSGTYTIRILWNGNTVSGPDMTMIIGNETVNGTTLTIEGDTDVTVYTNIGNLNLHVVDADSIPLENAAVYLIYPNGSALISPLKTDADGTVSLDHVAGGDYQVSVFWKGEEVFSSTLKITFTKDMPEPTETIRATVYNLVIRTYDSENMPISNVMVTISNSDTGNIEDFGTSDVNGTIKMRVPGGEKDINAYWHDVVVYSGNRSIDSSGNIDIQCSIYYLKIHIEDYNGKAISGADVSVEKAGIAIGYQRTNSSGDVVFRVAPGDYVLRARYTTTYMMEEINIEKTKNISVSSNSEETITFSEYPPNAVTTPLALFSILIILLIILEIATIMHYRKRENLMPPVNTGTVEVAPPEESDMEVNEEQNQ